MHACMPVCAYVDVGRWVRETDGEDKQTREDGGYLIRQTEKDRERVSEQRFTIAIGTERCSRDTMVVHRVLPETQCPVSLPARVQTLL